MPEIIAPPREALRPALRELRLTPQPFYEFGARRNPFEKPLYVVEVIVRDISPLVKHFKQFKIDITHQL